MYLGVVKHGAILVMLLFRLCSVIAWRLLRHRSGFVRVLPEQHRNKRGIFPKDSRTHVEGFSKHVRLFLDGLSIVRHCGLEQIGGV